ncbi:2,3-diketo-L-gulonate reductase [Mucilaginibacter sp. PPCGB 2223]|uniref:3-dehydro-L-gulonate 2-dehydrogenase n=1 Tax=Mucilaginibacter sp. PPCGB 2223 TaxID=1886027 RepID=UPI000825911A|nr:3-dehydro-L-gulonate 2-dehydrogenase [Mucilaginibacter sp. PPCGB 2223]OCX50642.1 2,3-diketo-L-gulonate reductase [Mucilaginibacter sp. PPCGB 2223]
MKIPFEELKAEFLRVLLKQNFEPQKAEQCAAIFAENSRDGVYTHGLNRFPTFVDYIKQGLIDSYAQPTLEKTFGLIEQWNGNLAPGMLNARFCTERAVALAKEHGMGCVAIRNTNHWMRGGTYGWQAAEAGCIGIHFTNTIALVPPWGGIDPRLGNNPLVIAVPRAEGHIVLDMAMSQYSMGKLMQYQGNNEELPLPGGYDEAGELSTDPGAIIRSKRLLPVGFWKGSGLALMLDLLVTILSQGKSTARITESTVESGVGQVFICIKDPDKETTSRLTEQILEFTKTSRPDTEGGIIAYPGENTLRTRIRNLKEGIPVREDIWNKVRAM